MGEITNRTDNPLDGDLSQELRELVQGDRKTISATSYTVVDDDFGRRLSFTSASAVAVEVPAGLQSNFYCFWRQRGGGQITFSAGAGASLLSTDSQLKSNGQYSTGIIDWDDADTYILDGNLTA